MSSWSSIVHLSKSVIRFSPVSCLIIMSLMLFRSLTSGVSLLLIIPLLSMIGFNVLDSQPQAWLQIGYYWLQASHLPLNLSSILLVFVILLIGIATIHYFEEIMRANWQEHYQHHLRKTVYQSLLDAKWDFFMQKKQSDLLHGLTIQLQATRLCHYQWLQVLNQGILIGAYFSFALWISWSMTCIVLLFAGFLLMCVRPLHRLIATRSQQLLQHHRSLFQAFYEQLSLFKIVKSCHREAAILKKILEDSQQMNEKSHRFTQVNAASKLGYQVGAVITFSAILYIGIAILKLPKDTLLLLMLAFSRLIPKISLIQQHYQQLLGQLSNYDSLQHLLTQSRLHQEINTNTPQKAFPFQQVIAFENVSFSYYAESSSLIIQDFSMQIKKNTTTILVGPSGSGKTTLADLLVGLLRPTQGHIRVDGQELTSQHVAAWRQSIAYVTQDAFLVNASIRDNLQLFCEKMPDLVLWEALRKVSAHNFVAQLPLGLETVIGDRGVQLSGGECQCIALARAILTHPQLLILDESTNSLDEEKIQTIQQALQQLHGKLTILVISHQWFMRDFADMVISIKPIALRNLNKVDLACSQGAMI